MLLCNISAIGVIAVFKDPSQQCDCIVLVRQYRPPLKAYTIEFPAGLYNLFFYKLKKGGVL